MEKKGSFRELFDTFFGKAWPMWVGAILLASGNILLFLVKHPWGGTGSYLNWGQHVYHFLGGLFENVTAVTQHPLATMNFLVVLGAFCASLLAREFALRIPGVGELLKGLIGGVLMGIGATIGAGCTIGGFFSGWSALSGGAIILVIGFTIGVILALRYLLWEMDKFPGFSRGGKSFLSGSGKKGVWQIWLGTIVLLGLIIFYCVRFQANNVMTWFAIFGILFGIISQRSRFCITRALREPFMTGETSAPIGLMAGLGVGIIGFTVIKYMGIGAQTPLEARSLAMMWVNSNFWVRGLIGGFIFGLGMTIAGGCAIGTLWRSGEGQVKLWFAAIGYTLMAPISKKFFVPAFSNLPKWAVNKVFLPDILGGYGGAIVLFLVIIILWYMFVKWNQKTGKFTAI